MTAADPRRDRLNRIASARPQCAGHKPQRSEAASTNELHTAIAAAEDVVDPRSVSAACHPLDAWDVQFGPVDALNPGCGYSLRVERNGQLVTHTGKQGDTGKDLAGPADCMRELSQILPGGFTPDPVPQGVMESIAAMGAEQDRRNAAKSSTVYVALNTCASGDVPPSAKCAALAFAAIDRAMHLPPLVALGPDSTDRTAEFRGSTNGGAA